MNSASQKDDSAWVPVCVLNMCRYSNFATSQYMQLHRDDMILTAIFNSTVDLLTQILITYSIQT